MNQQVEPVLKLINPHERDNNIQFFEENHKYIIITDSESKYTSVTTWCHSHFPKFNADLIIKNMMKGKNWKEGHKYWGLTPEEIKKKWSSNSETVSSAGTNMHFDIECFMNNLTIDKPYTHKELYEEYIKNIYHEDEFDVLPLEWKYFIQFIKDTPNLKPYRTEWTIYDEDLKLAGSIDMVYEKEDGTLMIYDWKRSKDITRINQYNKFGVSKPICHMPDSNFWHYSLQLNTYKHILERKYGKIVSDLFLVRLHPDSEEKNYELIKLPILQKEIEELCLERKI
jgi:hypothetical protein